MTASVGIDVGGTFTDLVAIDADGRIEVRKVLSTPTDQSEGVAAALRPFAPSAVERIVHGTTVATNALLERRGGRVVLCATEGFTDVIALRRQNRAALYDLAAHHPSPLADAGDVVAVRERIGVGGVVTPLTPEEANRVVSAALALRPDMIAICLLHSYADPSHERLLADAFRKRAPDLGVALSSEVFPEIREYERTTTTVAEAYLRPRVGDYLRRLGERLKEAGHVPPAVMTSSGGMRTAVDAASSAAQLALSGPAGGVVGAAAICGALGIDRALTIDIGGTSADVGLILDGRPLVEPGGAIAGIPISLPRVLVETVSAGGGSIAWIDDGGALRVGPRSAGSVPGPVAFGRGGSEPTVTDAQIALRRIRDGRLSGGLSLDFEAAAGAITTLASSLGTTLERAAAAIVATADAEMARALRRVSIERGVDPRECALVAFGGGGPLHACGLADTMGIRTVIVPPHAGVLSAVGLAMAAERREAMTSMVHVDPEDVLAIDASRRELIGRLAPPDGWTVRSTMRMRYAGQGHELDVDQDHPAASVVAGFQDAHQALFGYRLERRVEIVSMRCSASGPGRPVRFSRLPGQSRWSDEQPLDDGHALRKSVMGPVSIALTDATLHVAPRWRATAMEIGGWRLEREHA